MFPDLSFPAYFESETGRIIVPVGALSLVLPVLKVNVGKEGSLDHSSLLDIKLEVHRESLGLSYKWMSCAREFLGYVNLVREGRGFVWSSRIFPSDRLNWEVESTNEGSAEVRGWEDIINLDLFHADNIRGVTRGTLLTEGTYFVSVREWKKALNAGRWQAFPALWLKDKTSGSGIVVGVLSQNVWKYTVCGLPLETDCFSLSGTVTPPGIACRAFDSEEDYVSEEFYFEVVDAATPKEAFQSYLTALSGRLQPKKHSSLLANGPFWGSWNDRQPYFWDVSQKLVEKTISVLRARFPTVKSIEIDDGYAFGGYHEVIADVWSNLEDGIDPLEVGRKVRRVRRLGAGFAGEPGCAVPSDRFPGGMAPVAQEITTKGFVPAIWLGLDVVNDALVVKNHPEWFVKYHPGADDDPELGQVFSNDSANRSYVLDPSNEESRNYILEVLDILLRKWGFQALKLDFWSYAFENDGFRLGGTKQTAYELRRWFLEAIRDRLPLETYLLVACDISSGNPFLCPWVDSVRYGIDIGNGRWENVKYSALTGTFLLNVGADRFYLLNPDSVGLLRKMPPNERHCFWAWTAVTRSICEVAGDLSAASREELRPLQKLLLAPKNGAEVRLCESDHLEKNEPATLLFSPGDLFSGSEPSDLLPDGILCVFNWSEEDRQIDVSLEQLNLNPKEDYWDADWLNCDSPKIRNEGWTLHLPARTARLSHLTRKAELQPAILDSDWKVLSAKKTDNTIELTLEGDSPMGFLIFWPLETLPELQSVNLPTRISVVSSQIFRVHPTILSDKTQTWNVSIAFEE